MDTIFSFIIIMIAWFFGGVTAGILGMGAGIFAVPICLFVISPEQAIVSSCIIGFAGSLQLIYSYGKYSRYHDVRDFLLGCFPGAVLGVLFLKFSSIAFLELMISLIITIFIILELAKKIPFTFSDSFPYRFFSGVFTGFVGSSVSMIAAPLGIYALLANWEANRVRGNNSIFILVSMFLAVVLQGSQGLIDREIIKISLWGLAGTVAGQIIGIKIGKYINLKLFQTLTIIFLSIVDVILFTRGISEL